jgi:hypothetical protein
LVIHKKPQSFLTVDNSKLMLRKKSLYSHLSGVVIDVSSLELNAVADAAITTKKVLTKRIDLLNRSECLSWPKALLPNP